MSGANWIKWIPDQELQALVGSGKLEDARLVSIKEISLMLETHRVGGKYGREDQRNKYIAHDPISMKWIACDNTDGEAFTEEFSCWEHALSWINGHMMQGGPNGWEPHLGPVHR